jgi:deazaflavin-dependent oxidoreductase (nitroreductase family)
MASMGTALNALAYRLTGGRVGGKSTMLLTTTGRKSGKRRTVLLHYVRDGQDYVIIGSNRGRPKMPAWYLNLQAQPRADVQVARAHVPITARTVPLQERQRLWEMLVALDPGYERMIERTTRILPIVRLTPQAS